MLTLVELAKSDLLAPVGRPIATIPPPPFATGSSDRYDSLTPLCYGPVTDILHAHVLQDGSVLAARTSARRSVVLGVCNGLSDELTLRDDCINNSTL